MKPDVILYGSSMSDRFFEGAQKVNEADLLIVAGTSLTVGPANTIPCMVRTETIHRKKTHTRAGALHTPRTHSLPRA